MIRVLLALQSVLLLHVRTADRIQRKQKQDSPDMLTFISETVHSFPWSNSHTALMPWLYSSHTHIDTHMVLSSLSQSLLFLSHLCSSHYRRPIWEGSTLWLKQKMKSGFVITLIKMLMLITLCWFLNQVSLNTCIYNDLLFASCTITFVFAWSVFFENVLSWQ